MKRVALALVILLTVITGLVLYLGLRDDGISASSEVPANPPAEMVARGAYLARAGNCMACHTERGGMSYAGGRAIHTPFGRIYAPNITPDQRTGIGSWNADDFWQALHNGKSKDGTLLYPAFPYPNYTKVTRADADAMFAYLKTLPPVQQVNKEPELRFPFNHRALLVVWRALYFRPSTYEPQPKRDTQWNRGAYLTQGLGHCNACHTPRNVLGATQREGELSGASIPMLDWYAASLTGETGAGLGNWETRHILDFLKTGISTRGAASGPMAEVVRESTQHLTRPDIQAMAMYLKSLPQQPAAAPEEPPDTPENQQTLKLGKALYEKHCVECHKAAGEGEPPHYPPLAGNRALLYGLPVNAIRAVLHGGYPPSTQGNPQPFGMPPFGPSLNDDEAAALLSFIRNAWGNHAPMVTTQQVNRYRTLPLD